MGAVSKNAEVARLFGEIADALELKGELQFKVLAYRSAARTIESTAEDIELLAKQGRLQELPGIGAATAKKILEYLQTGQMKKHTEALAGLSPSLLRLLGIPGLGPKTLALAHKALQVNELADLKRVVEDGSLARLPGLGAKRVEALRKGIELFTQAEARLPLDRAMAIAGELTEYLQRLDSIDTVMPAGSLRRCRETVGDIDILITTKDPARALEHITKYQGIIRVIGAGETKTSLVVKASPHPVQVDIRVIPQESYGAALQYFTGSKEHNVKLRTIARTQGLKLSEYGLFHQDKQVAGKTEEEVYATLGLPVIPPELREDRGEIEAARAGLLPRLVELGDIRGDLHCHTSLSDGTAGIEELARAAQARGYEYLAITDHTRSAAYAGGLSIDELMAQVETIDQFNARLARARPGKKFALLKGAEVDILPDGSLDYPDSVLAKLDIVIASIHQGFKRNVTERICDALANPFVQILAHPSGRLISRREGYEVDLEKVLECAKTHSKVLELNSYPDRLDLGELWLRKARDAGIVVAISTDAHAPSELDWLRYGVAIARRGWLEPRNVLNCLGLPQLRRLLSRK